ncbi:hypothetical protein BTO30_15365 [Domibacillus antri]|uniref:Uncharacterized protein n=1 Tax=Domibacillus antri TaxID=1714264 RepID=A0A1Q8Q206_9BACI|nr:hypothetical protein [Domibacillus antri]OLN21360.1 hypothetical protein BTO30_15365 [Domibacillus antri]
MSQYRIFDKITVEEILENGAYLATFKERDFAIKGSKAIHEETGKAFEVKEIYEDIRNIQDEERTIIAKRKNLDDDLRKVARTK